MWKKLFKDYFSFTRRERSAVLALLFLFSIILLLPSLFRNSGEPAVTVDETALSALRHLIDSTGAENTSPPPGSSIRTGNKASDITPFYFDPNTLSEADWIRLGVTAKTASSIQKYVAKGGKFRTPEDLLKIYTLPRAVAQELIPYVRIQNQSDNTVNEVILSREIQPEIIRQRKEYFEIDINSTDTAELVLLPGIGIARATAIIKYRNLLGGFLAVDQVSEVYNMPDSVFKKLKPFLTLDTSLINKININTATFSQLTSHPYVGRQAATAIIAYRSQHGDFNDVGELEALHYFTGESLKKISLYLTVRQ